MLTWLRIDTKTCIKINQDAFVSQNKVQVLSNAVDSPPSAPVCLIESTKTNKIQFKLFEGSLDLP